MMQKARHDGQVKQTTSSVFSGINFWTIINKMLSKIINLCILIRYYRYIGSIYKLYDTKTCLKTSGATYFIILNDFYLTLYWSIWHFLAVSLWDQLLIFFYKSWIYCKCQVWLSFGFTVCWWQTPVTGLSLTASFGVERDQSR